MLVTYPAQVCSWSEVSAIDNLSQSSEISWQSNQELLGVGNPGENALEVIRNPQHCRIRCNE